ncbi:MAG: hypothetical protein COV52_04075 [Gammaproteobacteria bacterium CG11_big_fil_rev_8_21_14_0_20_46_22]|nr:MAG: hypothetical protein COW05_04270 [Gammaproteobacteria bacterium CG12_big_fil_rev_8_21_14_0_65_46_12]PIR11375.1 MAG: hypothetical protein COV52_04075 [Gammaproteobacteria bacterium CG11_big_fil_rev_8_21_14_0_20_46_22]
MLKQTVIAAALAAAASVAVAGAAPVMNSAAHNMYVGVGLDYSPQGTLKNNDTGAKLDKRGFGGNVFVGYHVNKYMGVEAGLDAVGQNKYKDSTGAVANVKSRWNLHGVMNAYLPVNAWFSPFAFGGVAWAHQKITGTTNTYAPLGEYSGMALVYGGGVQFNIQDFGVRVKYTRFNQTSITNSNNPLQDLVSLDVLYRFAM